MCGRECTTKNKNGMTHIYTVEWSNNTSKYTRGSSIKYGSDTDINAQNCNRC